MKLLDEFYTVSASQMGDNSASFDIRLNPEHFIFAAHFPGNPIVPGVCQMQIVGELLGEKLQRPLYVASVRNIKYLTLMTPTDELNYSVLLNKIVVSDEGCSVQAVLSSADKVYTKMTVNFQYNAQK